MTGSAASSRDKTRTAGFVAKVTPTPPTDGGNRTTSNAASVDPLSRIRALVDEQAEDEGLWAIYPFGEQPIAEAYLQQELRRLHALIEEVTNG